MDLETQLPLRISQKFMWSEAIYEELYIKMDFCWDAAGVPSSGRVKTWWQDEACVVDRLAEQRNMAATSSVTYLEVIVFVWLLGIPFITGHLSTREKGKNYPWISTGSHSWALALQPEQRRQYSMSSNTHNLQLPLLPTWQPKSEKKRAHRAKKLAARCLHVN